jgi:hypothetical protein
VDISENDRWRIAYKATAGEMHMADTNFLTAQGAVATLQHIHWKRTYPRRTEVYYRACFFLGEHEVLLDTQTQPLRIAEGDQIVVVGVMQTFFRMPDTVEEPVWFRLGPTIIGQGRTDHLTKRELLDVTAYHNLTSGVYGGSRPMPLALMLLFIGMLIPFCVLIFPMYLIILIIRSERDTRRAWEIMTHMTGHTYQ